MLSRRRIVELVVICIAAIVSTSETYPQATSKPRVNRNLKASRSSQLARRLSLSDSIEHMRPAVVEVVATIRVPGPSQSQPQVLQSSGSGFFISTDGHVVTALHVVRPPIQQMALVELLVNIATPNIYDENKNKVSGNFIGEAAEVIAVDELRDLALLRLRRNP